jgi:phospholipid/cholesterol/gamma-HCH transport system substrate-binding protein
LLAENTGPIASTVKNVETFSKALADNSDGVKSFMSAMSDVGTSIKPLIASLDERVKAVDPERVRSIVANADQISAKLNNTADKFDQVLTSVNGFLSGGDSKGLMAEVGDAAKSIRKLADNLDIRTKEVTVGINRFTGAGLRQYEALAVDGRKTLDEVNRTLRSLEKNPQQLLFGKKPAIPEYSGR